MTAEEKKIVVSYLMNILHHDLGDVYCDMSWLYWKDVIQSISILIKQFGIDLTDENIKNLYYTQRPYIIHHQDLNDEQLLFVYKNNFFTILENVLYKFFDGNLEKYLGQASLHLFGM